MKKLLSAAAPAAAFLLIAGAAQAQGMPAAQGAPAARSLELSAGVDYSTGTYGADADTRVLYAPLTARARSDRWRLEATVPFLSIEGPGEFIGGVGGPVVVAPGGETTRRSGLGDVLLGGALVVLPGGGLSPIVELAGTAKAPTAAEGLGTGEADFSAQVNLYQPLTDRLMLTGAAGYQWLGDPEAYQLENGALGMIGFNYKPSDAVDAGVALNFRQRAVLEQDDQITASPYLAWRSGAGWGLTGYGTAGFTESSPDFGAGLQLSLFR